MKKLEVLALKEVGEILKIVEADILTASVNNERVNILTTETISYKINVNVRRAMSLAEAIVESIGEI